MAAQSTEMSTPDMVAELSAKFFAAENKAVLAQQDADRTVNETELPEDDEGDLSDFVLGHVDDVYHDAGQAEKDLDAAREASRQFAKMHMGLLVEAALADAAEAGVKINTQ